MKTGDTIYAINECVMETGQATLTIGSAYKIKDVDSEHIMVIDDEGHNHWFEHDQVGKYFSTKKLTVA